MTSFFSKIKSLERNRLQFDPPKKKKVAPVYQDDFQKLKISQTSFSQALWSLHSDQ